MTYVDGKRKKRGSRGRSTGVPEGEDRFEPFISRAGAAVVEDEEGRIYTRRVRPRQFGALIEDHGRGRRRLGMFPTLHNGCCRWGCFDLDAHDESVRDRHPDGLALLTVLRERRIIAYLETSRGGRGVHVWLLFDSPGVPAADLHEFLEQLADELRVHGHVDVFPHARRGDGGPVLLPYFAGAVDLCDVDLKPVCRDRLESNPVSVVPATLRWPPPHWSIRSRGEGRGEAFREDLARLGQEGLVFWRGDTPQARRGARNRIAGAVARDILKKGGTEADFQAWDSGNEPPLASDKPRDLARWWKWASRRHRRILHARGTERCPAQPVLGAGISTPAITANIRSPGAPLGAQVTVRYGRARRTPGNAPTATHLEVRCTRRETTRQRRRQE